MYSQSHEKSEKDYYLNKIIKSNRCGFFNIDNHDNEILAVD